MSLLPISVVDANNASKSMAALQDAAGNNYGAWSLDTQRATYRAAASFTPFGTADLALITIKGSATKTIRIKRILLGGSSTALGSTLMGLQRVSAIGAGGTIVTPTVAKLDSGNTVAATAVVQHYTTAAQSLGVGVGGLLSEFQLFTTTVTTPTVAWAEMQCIFPEKGFAAGQALVLRGAADMIEVQNLNGGNVKAGSILQYVVEWEEDLS